MTIDEKITFKEIQDIIDCVLPVETKLILLEQLQQDIETYCTAARIKIKRNYKYCPTCRRWYHFKEWRLHQERSQETYEIDSIHTVTIPSTQYSVICPCDHKEFISLDEQVIIEEVQRGNN